MSSLYDQWKPLTWAEKAYIVAYPHHTLFIKQSKEMAYEETKQRFGRNGLNDESDAFRHCFWSAILSRDIGYVNAHIFTSAHESGSSNDPQQKEMDLHNNAVGLRIGTQFVYVAPGLGRLFSSNRLVSDKCFNALQKNELKIINP